ncbi:unnamed protein product [Ambrosiozyma monospora]|uniref:Unnamed protein product n=1 Tax=Ambrosiozyma monospora TaxID=43982 RepID=A0ACB5T5P1_AMBMO|nr:unnamed protein product [Ambrosiozyma monospora]
MSAVESNSNSMFAFTDALSILQDLPLELLIPILKLSLSSNSGMTVQTVIEMALSDDYTAKHVGMLILKECAFQLEAYHISIHHESFPDTWRMPYECSYFISKLFKLLKDARISLDDVTVVRELPDEPFDKLYFNIVPATSVDQSLFVSEASQFSNNGKPQDLKVIIIRDEYSDIVDCFMMPKNMKQLMICNSESVGIVVEFHDLNGVPVDELWCENPLKIKAKTFTTRFGTVDGNCLDFRNFNFSHIKKLTVVSTQKFMLLKINDIPETLEQFDVVGMCYKVEVPQITPSIKGLFETGHRLQEVGFN